jgi:hypothetical protein
VVKLQVTWLGPEGSRPTVQSPEVLWVGCTLLPSCTLNVAFGGDQHDQIMSSMKLGDSQTLQRWCKNNSPHRPAF